MKQNMLAVVKNVVDAQPAGVAAHVRKRFLYSDGHGWETGRFFNLRPHS